ncbi:MAG: NAD(+)/NADH kinase [Planctomycetota bacterium]|nr:NAD(+)/NADH kinase [Planctomycetota bacterium]
MTPPTRSGPNSKAKPMLPANRAPRFLIVGDRNKLDAETLAAEIQSLLEDRDAIVSIDFSKGYEPIECKPDFVIVLGGDGAILATSHRLGKRRVPVMGVNLGTVGFLAGVTPERVETVLDQVFADKARCEDRAMMSFAVKRNGKVVVDSHVLNEIVVSRIPQESLITVDFVDEGRHVCSWRGDGVIVSTATGSTAYNLSAGGPILAPSLDALVIQPLAPHMLGMRSLVLSSNRSFTLKVYESGSLTSDGHLEGKLQAGDRIRVNPSRRRLPLVVDPQNRFYSRLRKKLHWGESPGPG